MRVYSPTLTNCFKITSNPMHFPNNEQQHEDDDHHHRNDHHEHKLWPLPIKCTYFFAFVFVTLLMQHYLVISVAADDIRISGNLDGGVTKGFKSRMRSPKIASIHILQPVPESLGAIAVAGDGNGDGDGDEVPVATNVADNQTNIAPAAAGKFEIRSVSGEPSYKSVNLTWEVEFVPSDDDAITNSSAEVEPPTSFQVFFCEIQSFGPHRCRSKLVNGNTSLQMYDSADNDIELEDQTRQVRQYMTQIDNLRMATKYSFHIRSTPKHKSLKVTGRSELFDNEIANEDFLSNNMVQEQTIVIPTKGFSAQATRCLPTASEIEVETGPYFGGKIVVDGGNCGIKGEPNEAKDKYVMRIDHKTCGSMVKPETNTVETFITVQENLGIFTHSTRRFVVVCSYQSGLQTVRASFSVPGRGGASAVQQEQYEEEERMGRGLKPMRYVDKSELVLKETETETEKVNNENSEETQAIIEEMANPTINYNGSEETVLAEDGTTNAVTTLENIIPDLNEERPQQTEVNEVVSKHEHNQEIQHNRVNNDEANNDKEMIEGAYRHEKLSAKYAKLTANLNDGRAEIKAQDDYDESDDFGAIPTGRGFSSGFEQITLNMGSIMLTVLVAVILIGIFIYVLYRETNSTPPRNTTSSSISSSSSSSLSNRQRQHKHLHEVDSMPRTLGNKNQDLLA